MTDVERAERHRLALERLVMLAASDFARMLGHLSLNHSRASGAISVACAAEAFEQARRAAWHIVFAWELDR
jgi:hypothetical protein